MGRLIDNEEHWRERAQDTRKLAEQIDDAKAKLTMLEIAESYEHLAERAKQRKLESEKSG